MMRKSVLAIATLLSTARAMVVVVPERMALSPAMRSTDLNAAVLTPIRIDADSKTVTLLNDTVTTGAQALDAHTGRHGSLCFVVRRPG